MSDASSIRVVVQEAPFDFGAEAERFAAARTDMGAVVTFTGVVVYLMISPCYPW